MPLPEPGLTSAPAKRRRIVNDEGSTAAPDSPPDESEVLARARRALTSSEIGAIARAWDHDDSSLVVVWAPRALGGLGSAPQLGKHFGRLRDYRRSGRINMWLFDETIINTYMYLLQERDKRWCEGAEGRRRTCFLSSFFLEKMLTSGSYLYEYLRRSAERSIPGGNVFALRRLVVPININNCHWCLCVADIEGKHIQLYDPMWPGYDTSKYGDGLKRWLTEEAKKWWGKGNDDLLDIESWVVETSTPAGTPRQPDKVNCGVYVSYFANFLAAGASLSFNEDDIPCLRRRMTLDLLGGAVGD